jgi:hypothetical protein
LEGSLQIMKLIKQLLYPAVMFPSHTHYGHK